MKRGLFVGIGPYENYTELPGAYRDAVLLSEAFRDTYGFVPRVIPAEATPCGEPKAVADRLLRRSVVAFKKEIAKASLALIYVAAHGVSDHEKKSYIITSDDAPPDELGEAADLEQLLYPAEFLLDCLESCPGYKLLVLDCCRTNPLRSGQDRPRFRSGVAISQPPNRGMVIYSTQYNAAAYEKRGQGLFASILDEEIRGGEHRKAISLFQAVQKRLNDEGADDEIIRDYSGSQFIALELGSRHDEILLVDESDRYARAQVEVISLAGNVTSLSSSERERTLAVATNRGWRSLKADRQSAPVKREPAADPTLRFYRHEGRRWKKVHEGEAKRKHSRSRSVRMPDTASQGTRMVRC